jgi:membrane-bound serine protease (ClpP class)
LLWMVLAVLIVAQSGAVGPSQDPQPKQVSSIPGLAQPASLPASNLALPSGSDIVVIPISGMIYDFTLVSLKRRVKMAIDSGASLIVIELDTPGGVVTSALAISKYIKNLSVPTVAWVHNSAYSAGIMIASACDEIVMSTASATGDCAPIIPGMNLAPTERAKLLSPILEEFRDSARSNGYDYALFQAMCVLNAEVYLIEKSDGSDERRLVNQIDFSVMVKGDSTQGMTGPTPGPTPGQTTGPNLSGTQLAVQDVGAVTLTLATEEDRGAWHAVEVLPSGAKLPGGRVHDGTTLLTLNQTRAQDIGLSKGRVSSNQELKQHYQAASVAVIAVRWSEGLAAVLTSWWMRAILTVVFLLGAYIELQAPGLSLPGAVAAVALIALIGAPFVIGLAEVWHILLFLIGFVLVIIEIVFMPAFGLLGVGGLMMMFMGVVLGVVPSGSGLSGQSPGWLPPAEMQGQLLLSMFTTLLSLLASGVGFYFITKHFGKIPGLNRLILDAAQPSGAAVGVDVTGERVHVSGDEVLGVGVVAVGVVGETASDLRPTGTARFGGHIIDVVSVGPYIGAGQAVKVIEVHGNRIVVDEV